MGPSALFPVRKEGVLWIFIALQNLSHCPGSNPQRMGLEASTLALPHQGDHFRDARKFKITD
jgi:hypothetical protein